MSTIQKSIQRDRKRRKRRRLDMVESGRSVFLLDYLIKKKAADDLENNLERLPTNLSLVQQPGNSRKLSSRRSTRH